MAIKKVSSVRRKRDTLKTDMTPKVSSVEILKGKNCMPPPPSVPFDLFATVNWPVRAEALLDDMLKRSKDDMTPEAIKELSAELMEHLGKAFDIKKYLDDLESDLSDNEEKEVG